MTNLLPACCFQRKRARDWLDAECLTAKSIYRRWISWRLQLDARMQLNISWNVSGPYLKVFLIPLFFPMTADVKQRPQGSCAFSCPFFFIVSYCVVSFFFFQSAALDSAIMFVEIMIAKLEETKRRSQRILFRSERSARFCLNCRKGGITSHTS